MQFVIQNNSDYTIAAFHSNVDYNTVALRKIIQPNEVLRKAAYEYYWRNVKSTDWVNHVQHSATSLKMYGFMSPGESIDVYNIVRVPEYLYIFCGDYQDKTATLKYCKLALKSLFSEYSDYSVNVLSVAITNPGEPNVSSEYNGSAGELHFEYTDTPKKIGSASVKWQPTDDVSDTQNDHPWLMPLLIVIMVGFLIAAIVITATIFMRPARELNYFIHKNVTGNAGYTGETYQTEEKKTEEPPIFLD